MSIPVDLSEDAELAKMEEKGVKGRYVSVELLQELDNGKVEWRMATSSTPGGNIPSFVAESTMASTIAKVCRFTTQAHCLFHIRAQDVTHFLHWFHSVRAKPDAPAQAPES